tara:strand:- start:515 stop:1894 length:1380 start_codon:yes stop_codon:yes gene_type:complete
MGKNIKLKKIIKNPLVTIYITNHNYGKYINKAIRSVLDQSLKEFELIIIDDGSTDDSLKIINKYKNHKKIKIIYQKNKGLTVSNNLALRLSRGKYIIRLDADDWLEPNALQIMSDYLEKNPKIGLVFPDYFEVDEKNNILNLVRRHNFKKVKLLDKPAHGACTMVRKECLTKIGGYNEKFDRQDGYYLWIEFIQKYKVMNINLPLFFYRQHNLSLTKNEEKLIKTRSEIIKNKNLKNKSNKKALAILPVRGKSVNPDNFFLKKFSGKSLGCWTIDTLLKSKKVSKILVTTPDKTILNFLKKKYKKRILLFKRDLSLSGINIALDQTIKKSIIFAKKKGIKFDYIFQLSYKTPFLKNTDIDSFVYMMEFFNTDEVIGVKAETDRMYKHNGSTLELINNSSNLRLERDEIYRGVPNLRLFKKKNASNNKKKKILGHYILDQKSALAINNDLDWKMALSITH